MPTKYLVCAFGAAIVLLLLPSAAVAKVFDVNTTADGSAIPGEEVCTGSTTCTLREAIEEANDEPGEDTIRFTEVPPIDPRLLVSEISLPTIDEKVTIEGDTLPGATPGVPAVELVPVDMVDEFTTGFDVQGGTGTRIEGFAIGGFSAGIEVGPNEGEPATDTEICGDYLGTELDGETAAPNRVGVEVWAMVGPERPVGTKIGGPPGCAGNVIAANTEFGVLDDGLETTIAGNSVGIGAQPSGVELPNGESGKSGEESAGIFVGSVASKTTIGGPAASGEEANFIAKNHGPGAFVQDDESQVSIRHDSFTENEGLGIEIAAHAPVAPTISRAESPNATTLELEGTVTGEADGEHVALEFFGSPSCDPSGAGEGQTFLGAEPLQVEAGSESYAFPLFVEVPTDDTAITATMTREDGATSEFSTCATYQPPPAPPRTFTVTTLEDSFHGECATECSLRDAIEAADESPSDDTIDFDVAGKIEPVEQDLPDITEPVTIDGTTAPGYDGSPVIEIDGSEALNEGATEGLKLTVAAEGSTIKGLAVTHFGEGIIVLGNHSLVEADTVAHNSGVGVRVTDPAPQTTIRRSEIYDDAGGSIEFETPNSVPSPVLEAFVAGPSGTTVFVPLVGAVPDETYALDVFADATCEKPGEHGPAEVLIGSGEVTTDASGEAHAEIDGRALTGIDAETFTVTATETATGTTSQIGHCAYTPPETELESGPSSITSSTSATFTFSGSSHGEVERFACKLDGGTFEACASGKEYTGLGNGSHTFTVKAISREGTPDQTPPSYTWKVDTEPPEVSITSGPASPTNSTAAGFEFTATDPGSAVTAVECSLDGSAFAACDSPKAYTGLAAGPHSFEVRATDEAGNTSDPVVRSWRIVTEAPSPELTNAPPASTASTAATFEFDSGGGSEITGYECSLDGGAYAACGSPQNLTGLAPGTHAFAVRSEDEAGNTSAPTVYRWTVASPPVTEAAVAEGPAPTNGEKVVVAPDEGKVLIKLPGTNKFVKLEELKEIPIGAVIDATRGKVVLTSIDPDGTEQSADFFGGVFKVKQKEGADLVVLELLDTDACPAPAKSGRKGRADASALDARPGSGAGGKLWGSGHGHFRTEGNQGSATVRGTIWLVEDRCNGTTFFRTRRGIVTVRDFVLHKTLPLPAGKTYVAGEG